MTIERCQYADVAHLKNAAAREGSSVKPSANTTWFCARTDAGDVVGCSAAVFFANGRARVKAVYLQPPYRFGGWGRRLMDAAVEAAREAETVEVIAVEPDGWRCYGFEPVHTRPNGGVVMRLPEPTRVP